MEFLSRELSERENVLVKNGIRNPAESISTVRKNI
jgi:hypothetical protein